MDINDGVTELHRSAVRVVLVDASAGVLLLHVIEPQHLEQGDRWELPGSGIDYGQPFSPQHNASCFEETGLRVPVTDIKSPHWFRTVAFLHAGIRRIQDEAIALATIPKASPAVEATALSVDEDEIYIGHRWWTVGEIETNNARFPSSLPRAASLSRRRPYRGTVGPVLPTPVDRELIRRGSTPHLRPRLRDGRVKCAGRVVVLRLAGPPRWQPAGLVPPMQRGIDTRHRQNSAPIGELAGVHLPASPVASDISIEAALELVFECVAQRGCAGRRFAVQPLSLD